jgi:hypothetical protein
MWRSDWRKPFIVLFKHFNTVHFAPGALTRYSHSFNMRMPNELLKLLDEDLKTIQKELKLGDNELTRSKLIIYAVMTAMNYEQTKTGKYVRSDGTMQKFIDEVKEMKKNQPVNQS